ncbi:MAG: transglycosylase SLT domain-containing protein [Solirubrobacteraceae bacterium]
MRSRRRTAGRRRLAIAGGALAALVALIAGAIALATSGGKSAPPPLPLPGIGQPAKPGDPFAYVASRESDFVARAIAGSEHVLFTKSPGGALATAARVAPFREIIDQATAGTNIDPSLLEALVFVESAGRPNVIAGLDPADASGLTQILASTGQSLLGMHINLTRSRQLTGKIDTAAGQGKLGLVARLQRQRARIDDRFDPRKALAATVRYLQIAEQHFARPDLAVESYHMGIGNLQNVLNDYDGGKPVPYAQLYFDTAPDHHTSAYNLISGFGDDSSLYYWRLLGAEQIMRLYRTDRAALSRLISLQTAVDSQAYVLHPPQDVHPFANPDALDNAYARRTILPLPSNARALGLSYDPGIGSMADQLHVSPALYRGLRGPALDLLIELAARVRSLSGGTAPLTVTSAVSDQRYQQLLGVSDPPAAAGWSFTIARRYVKPAQADAFQAMLDRLQALNVIAWQRFPSEIEITVASDASQVLVHGP